MATCSQKKALFTATQKKKKKRKHVEPVSRRHDLEFMMRLETRALSTNIYAFLLGGCPFQGRLKRKLQKPKGKPPFSRSRYFDTNPYPTFIAPEMSVLFGRRKNTSSKPKGCFHSELPSASILPECMNAKQKRRCPFENKDGPLWYMKRNQTKTQAYGPKQKNGHL